MTHARFAAQFRHFLVVEDSAIIAMELEMSLNELGIADVILASTGEQALNALNGGMVDAALVDLNLGGDDGRIVARELAENGTAFAIMTGFADMADLRAHFPGTSVLRKPFSRKELEDVLERLRR